MRWRWQGNRPHHGSHDPTTRPAADRHARQADRLTTIRLRMAIWREPDERQILTPAEIDVALGMPAVEATSLLTGTNGARATSRCSRPR